MRPNKTIAKYLCPITIVLGIILTIWLRTPFLKEGSPYLYREDEGHHFNRIVNMMKSGDLNPHYFHKPSLHFYLRLPVVAAGFLWSVKKGEINNLNEIVTSDPFGVADYSFSVSHPRLLLVSRTFSLLLQLGSIALTFAICMRLLGGFWLPAFAAILFALSPSAISESSVIGVDGVMTFFCLLSVYLGLRAHELKTTLALFWCAVAAGLAVSSKYNALPIIVVPLIACLTQKPYRLERSLIALFIPWIAFIAASPYIIISLPEFLNQLAYEIWHYGIAGHIGHMAEPGLSQLKFYCNWLSHDGLGLIAASLALCGSVLLIFKFRNYNLLIALAFPVLFFLLMIAQKANFERNMVVIIPFAAIFSALTLSSLKKIIPQTLICLLAAIALIQPAVSAFELRSATAVIPESRLAAASEIQALAQEGKEFAVDGKLQFARKLLEVPGVSRSDFTNASPAKAYQDGFDYLAIRSSDKFKMLSGGFFEDVREFDGANEPQRIVQNPALSFLKRKTDLNSEQTSQLQRDLIPLTLVFPDSKSEISFAQQPDPQLWLQKSIQSLLIKTSDNTTLPQTLKLNLFSPWPDQVVTFYVGSNATEVNMAGKALSEVSLQLEPGKKEQFILVKSSRVHSPKALGISIDTRRLAVAIKAAALY